MKHILDILLEVSQTSVELAKKLSVGSFEIGKNVTDLSLSFTGNLLYTLSSLFFFLEDWKNNLEQASSSIFFTKENVAISIQNSIDGLSQAFSNANHSLHIARDFAEQFIYEHKGISSVIGSSHHNLLGISNIKLSFRMNNKNVTPEEVWKDFSNSNKEKIILLVPGLFCDETLWDWKTEVGERTETLGLASLMESLGYYLIFLRFNPGMHISSNGQELANQLGLLYKYFYKYPLNILAYSQGGLIVRSALYYGKLWGYNWVQNTGKVVLISSPDGGSYLEKIGFWIGFLLELSPNLALKLIGILGNLRSDGIKDLSHGIIREEDWKTSKQIRRYTMGSYYGELDEVDAYQIYSLFSGEADSFATLLGDGIIEKPSLENLSERVYNKIQDGKKRTYCIYGKNHFSILDSAELSQNLKEIFS
jgi:pimeloyl-ACP methyl ester carboxylesterase